MARPIDEFVLAWEALAGNGTEDGWRSIPVAPAGPCILMAGRRFPGNEEALLAGFATATIPSAEKLPEGRGFEVSRADPNGDGRTWISLTRKESGSRELFAEMVGDVAGVLDANAALGEARLVQALLGRVRAWQEFMRKGAQTLSLEAEIGLVGELSFLEAILRAGVPAALAVEAWVGPLDAPQDFFLGTGAVEVKATVASAGFPARMGSLDQLDDSIRKPLYLAGVRLSPRASGRSLPEIAAALRTAVADDALAERVLAERLIAAGYHDGHADRYARRFAVEGIRILGVTDGFPRLVQGSVPEGIRKAVYEIDLDRVPVVATDMKSVLKELGAL